MLAEPTFAGGWLPILFVRPILRHAGCRWQGDHGGVSGTPHHRRERRVIIPRLTMRELSRETMGTRERLRGKVLGAIKGNQPRMGQHAERVQQMRLLALVQDLKKQGRDMMGCHPSKAGTDLMVAGDVHHAEQGLRVIVPFAVLPPPLVCQK